MHRAVNPYFQLYNKRRKTYKQLHAPTRSLDDDDIATISASCKDEWGRLDDSQRRLYVHDAPAVAAKPAPGPARKPLWGLKSSAAFIVPPEMLVHAGVHKGTRPSVAVV